MRLRIPLIPIAIHVRLELLPWTFRLPRFSLRILVLVVAIIAIILGAYESFVEMPNRRERYFQADRTITHEIRLLEAAAQEAIDKDQENRELLGRDLKSIEKEEALAATFPEGSEKRDHHLYLASLWKIEAARVARLQGPGEEIAKAFRLRAAGLRIRQRLATNDLAAIERLVEDSRTFPNDLTWKRHKLLSRLDETRRRMSFQRSLLGTTHR